MSQALSLARINAVPVVQRYDHSRILFLVLVEFLHVLVSSEAMLIHILFRLAIDELGNLGLQPSSKAGLLCRQAAAGAGHSWHETHDYSGPYRQVHTRPRQDSVQDRTVGLQLRFARP